MIFSDAASAVGWADAVANSADVRGVLSKLLSTPGFDISGSDAKDLALTITGKVRMCQKPASELYLLVYGERNLCALMDMVTLLCEIISPRVTFEPRRLMGLVMILVMNERETLKFGKPIPRAKIAKMAGVHKEEFRQQIWVEAESKIRELLNTWLESADRQITLELEAVGVL